VSGVRAPFTIALVIEIRIGDAVLTRVPDASIGQIVPLQVACIRRFQQGCGFPVTFAGLDLNDAGKPAGHRTVWLHPSMPVVFDYGTDYAAIEVDEAHVDKLMEAMDATELGVIISTKYISLAFTQEPHP